MSIADLKTKIATVVSGNSSNDNLITKRLEIVSQNLKTVPSILSNDFQIEGQIHSSGVIEIEGSVRGIINANSVILRENGFVNGTIIAEFLSIRGSFDGNIKAKNIRISGKAKIQGEIEYGSLAVEDGASIDGQFKKLC